jgi:AraC-like DNA-binding protein
MITAPPCALLWPAGMMVCPRGFVSPQHRHHCIQLMVALRGYLRVRGGPRQRWIECGAVLIRPDVPHEVDATECSVLMAFVDVESELGRALADKIESDISVVLDPAVAEWRRLLGGPDDVTSARVEHWVRDHLLIGRRRPSFDPRVRRVLLVIHENLGNRQELSLPRLAAISGLSQSRLMHVFTQSVGIALRPYILWLRLHSACGHIVRGACITMAAHSAGFSDAAHLTRTMRRTMGITPSELTRRRSDVRGAADAAN